MVSVGIMRNHAKENWIVTKTTDGKEFATEAVEKSLEDILEELGKIEDEVIIGFDKWGAKTCVEIAANFISQRKNMKIALVSLTGEYKARLTAEQIAVNAMERFR